MSREFWQRVFRSQGSSNFINSLNRVDKWDNPPEKNETGLPQSTDVCGEGAKYFSHLGEAEVSDPTASKTLTDLLSAGATVNKKTADMVGADFTVKEVESIASHVPLNKSPGTRSDSERFLEKLFQENRTAVNGDAQRMQTLGRISRRPGSMTVSLPSYTKREL